jgi:hypothetical protein
MESIEMVCKFVLLVLTTQLGKTFTTINRILTELNDDEEFGKSIHLVFTMNTLLNNRQFAKRLETIENHYGKGSIVIFASQNTTKYRGVTKLVELQGLCVDSATCPKVVVMCSNEYRYEDGLQFIEILENNRTNIERVFAYYDELHRYISPTLRQKIEHINTMKIVKGIIAMTATPLRIWEKTGFWSNIRMIQLDEFNEKDYAGYKNMIWNCDDTFFPTPFVRPIPKDFDAHDTNTLGFIRHILNKHPRILAEGTRTFIPAHVRRIGHNSVRDLVFERNPCAVVVVLNGAEKTLTYKDSSGFKKTLDLGSINDEEVCETIATRMISQKLTNYPLVITGFLCVGMGQTLTHKTLGSFTSAIISHLDQTNDEVYQLFGRLTGRMLNWGDKYVQTQVYCPTKIMNRCHVMEECARRVALDHAGEGVTRDEYLSPMDEMGDAGLAAKENIRVEKEVKAKRPKRPQPIEHPIAFTTINDVNEFLTNTFKKPVAIKAFHKPAGSEYQLSTRLNAYYKKKMAELLESDRLIFEFYKKINLGMNISSKEGHGQQYMVYPVYPIKDSPPSDVRYYVRYLKPTD